MPVTTRSQRTTSPVHFVAPKPVNKSDPELYKYCFIYNMKKLFAWCESAQGKENKIRMCLETYRYINKELPEIIQKTSVNMWINFAATAYMKTTEYISEIEKGNWADINSVLIENFTNEFTKTRNFVITLIKNNWNLSSEYINKVKKYITSMENARPRRSVKPVDYTGMDSIEVECDSGETITIWDDFTKEYDPDYEFEEHEE